MNALQCVAKNDLTALRTICHKARYTRNQQYDMEEVDYYGNTALLKACYLGRLECALTLLDYGASIRALNYYGQNALTLATYAGHAVLIKELIRRRSYADFNQSSIVPALCVAVLRQNNKLIHYFRGLSNAGRDVKSAHGLYPEHINKMLGKGATQQQYTHFKI